MNEHQGISATVILDSVSPDGHRLTTMELIMPRFLLAQWNTHRTMSRNAASSRAVPTWKLIAQVLNAPFIPGDFARNQTGMQAGESLSGENQRQAGVVWYKAAQVAAGLAENLADLGVHKQWANRLLEPFLFVKVLASATEWGNLLRLRRHDDAQPEFQQLAQAIFDAREASEPVKKKWGDWHLPYVADLELFENLGDQECLKRWSVARCARLGLSTPLKDEELYERLLNGSGFGHFSPFEHVAQASGDTTLWGNFRGWKQFRKTFSGECG